MWAWSPCDDSNTDSPDVRLFSCSILFTGCDLGLLAYALTKMILQPKDTEAMTGHKVGIREKELTHD
jgi:hypothetical protein